MRCTGLPAAQTSSTVAGTVKDTQGGIIPGATVTLVSEARGTTFDGQSERTGDFVISNIPADTYTIRVTMDGFKTTERKGVAVSLGERVAVGNVTIEVGTLAETVLVTGEAPMIQAQTGERSFTVDTRDGREPARSRPQLRAVCHAVAGRGRGGQRQSGCARDGARTNYLLDGIATVNTGGNQQGLQLNSDAIAEVKVIASAYQAEYGRTSGIQISGVTKSGTNQFRGSVYDIERDSDWNSNSWANVATATRKRWPSSATGVTRSAARSASPADRTGCSSSTPNNSLRVRPAARSAGSVCRHCSSGRGIFRRRTDNTGARFNLIRDAATGLPCTAADTRGCFQDGGVLGPHSAEPAVPASGVNILKTYPAPNVDGLTYNLETVDAERRQQHLPARRARRLSGVVRSCGSSAKYAGQNATVQDRHPGSIPGFNDTVFQFPAILVPSANVDLHAERDARSSKAPGGLRRAISWATYRRAR